MHEDDYIMISALQHFAFCERQCALIHLEQQWAENQFTVQGDLLHERVDSGVSESRTDTFISRSIRIKSDRLGLIGTADVVEFFRVKENGALLPGKNGLWMPCPVEYKRGSSKKDDIDRIQLCAQAICLEEMLKVSIMSGALYYAKTKKREKVQINEVLRRKTEDITVKVHKLLQSGKTPAPIYDSKCHRCSLFHQCQPKVNDSSAKTYYNSIFEPSDL